MEDFEFDEQDGGLPVLTKKSTAPTEGNDLPILKKKVDGNVSANGMPLPSPSKSDFQSVLESGQQTAGGTNINKITSFKEAAQQDKDRNQSYLGAVWNNVVGSVERLAGGAARLANKFEYSPQNEIMANAMKAATEATGVNYQALQEKEVADKFKNFIGKAKTGASSEEHRNKIIEGFDVTNGIGLDDIKALGVMIPAMVTDMAAAVPTAGTSFLVQGYDDALSTIDKMPQAKDMKESTRTAFGIGGGIVAGVLEKLGLDNILKSGTTTRYVTAKVIKETAEELAKKGAKVTAEELEQAIAAKATDMLKNTALKNTIKAGAKSAAIEGVTEATQEGAMDLLKVAANKLEDKEIFDTEELKNTAASRYLNNAAAGGLLGGIAGGAFSRLKNLERHVQEQVSEAKSQEDIQKILSEINDNVKDGTISEDEAGTLINVIKPGEVRKPDATTIGAPEYTPETKKSGVTVQLPKQETQTLLEEDAKENEIQQPTEVKEPTATEATETAQPTEEAKPTTEATGVNVERPKTELSFRGLQDVANEFGYQDVKSREPVTDIQEKQNALNTITDWRKKGEYNKNVDELLTKIQNRETVPTAKQRLVLQQHLADEVAKLRSIEDKNSPEFDKQLSEVKRIKDIGQIARQESGAALRIGDTRSVGSPIENYEDAFVAKMEATGADKLTDEQKAEVEGQVKVYEERASEAEAKVTDLEQKMADMSAEKEFEKTAKSTPRVKKSKEDFVKLREDLKTSIRDKWNKASEGGTLTSVPFPGATQVGNRVKKLIEISPDVAKLMRSYVEEGVTELADVTKRIYNDLKEHIPELSEKDVHDIIAGEYSEKKPTQSQAQADYRDLKDEARLLNELDKVANGVPKTEKEKIQRNQKIKDLQEQLKKLKKDTGYDDLSKLKSIKERNKKDTEKIQQRISKKDFDNKPKPQSIFDNKELQKKYPKEYKEALDAVKAKEDAKHDFDIALLRDEIAKRSVGAKIADAGSKTVGTVKAIVTGIDNSAVGIQSLVSLLSRPSIAPESLGLNISHMFSQKRFDRWLTELHNSKMYPLMKESGLSVTEPMSLKESEKEEAFNNRFNGTVKIKGKEYNLIDAPLRPFERAFTTMGNAVRVLAFKNIAGKYLEQGYTFEKNPELFKSLAQRLNTESGRGKENEVIRKASDIATIGVWSPKLMASKFNMLGISDLTAGLTGGKIGTKGYYSQLHPKERAQALLDVVKFSSSVLAITYLSAWAMGGDVDTDPLSPTFMTVTMPSGKSINFTGGFSGYIRYLAQIASGYEKKDGEYKKTNRLEKIGRFFRSKTPPLTSSAVNAAYGKDFMGKPTTLGGELYNMLPISPREIGEAIAKDGSKSLFTALPTFYGMNIRDNKDFDGKDDDLKTLVKRNRLAEEQDKKGWKNFKKGGNPITKQEEQKYNQEHDDYVEERMKKLWEGTDSENIVTDEEGNIQKGVTFEKMTKTQAQDAVKNIQSDATRKFRKELFGVDEKKKKAQSKLSKLKARFKD